MERKPNWKKPRAFTLSDTLFGCAKAMAKMKKASTSEIVSLCILKEWEREVDAHDKEEMLERLAKEMEDLR